METSPSSAPAEDGVKHAYRNILVLALCHAAFISVVSLMIAFSSLVGKEMAPSASFATLPLGVFALVHLATTFFASQLMGRIGRKAGFLIGGAVGTCGGLVAAVAVEGNDFILFCTSYGIIGFSAAFATYYRFAAVEGAGKRLQNRALSWVLAGGILAAFVGPFLANHGRGLIGTQEFTGSAAAIAVIWFIALPLLLLLALPKQAPQTKPSRAETPRVALAPILGNKQFQAAALCAAVSYGVMNMLMVATPLAMHDAHVNGGFAAIARTIQLHVLAMYIPSFFTGNLIDRFGTKTIMFWGIAILALAIGASFVPLVLAIRFPVALIVLGIGWNFLYIGASSMITKIGTPQERSQIQGANEFVVLSAIAATSLSVGYAYQQFEWSGLNLLMLPLLAFAAFVLARTPPAEVVRAPNRVPEIAGEPAAT